jgi:hypothetical protein
MAAKKGNKKVKKDTGVKPRKGMGKLGFYTTAIVVIFASPFIFPTIILAVIGLLPTLVALFTDTDRDRSSTAAVGAMNCAGLTPFIIDLWMKGQTVEQVFRIMTNPSTWVVILGGAAIGQLIVFAVPQTMALMTFANYEKRLKLLKKHLEDLKSNWGQDVGTVKPINQIIKME